MVGFVVSVSRNLMPKLEKETLKEEARDYVYNVVKRLKMGNRIVKDV
jgi:hypothetical protein